MAKKVITHHFSLPFEGATRVKAVIDAGDGNLIVETLTNASALANGTLQYPENNPQPVAAVSHSGGETTLTVRSGGKGQQWLRMPWAGCNGATEWKIQLNPSVPMDVTAHTDGGNIRLDLSGMTLTRLAADTGGGNITLALPESAAGLSVLVKTGAGNVEISLPDGTPARIQATSGLGKVTLDSCYLPIDKHTYQSADYETAANRVEITASSGVGNVTITERVGQPAPAVLQS